MGAAGRANAAAKFDLRKNVAQLIESYGITEFCQKPDRQEGLLPQAALPDGSYLTQRAKTIRKSE